MNRIASANREADNHEKWCRRCDRVKYLGEFRFLTRKRDWSTYCKTCMRTYQQERRAGSIRLRVRQLLQSIEWQARKFGYMKCTATAGEVVAAYTGSCVVCKAIGKMHIDHCHRTGKFRGWLCRGCNHAIGHARDSPDVLRGLADYLDVTQGEDDSPPPQ
jgi:hypothetical protein